MDNDSIRSKVSEFLGILIPPGKWEQYLEALDKEGIPNRKQMIGLFLIICQQIENLEAKVKLLSEAKVTIKTTKG